MGHDKLRKFAENETFGCLLQPSSQEILGQGGIFSLNDQPIKGNWNKDMFPRMPEDTPVVLELGCGKGEYTIDLAQREKDCNYIGVDIKGARLWKGARFATEHQLPNVAFLRTRVEFLQALFAPQEVSQIWLTFSDPQMKSENSRLTSPLFMERYRNVLRKGGIIHLKTDSMFLHQYTVAMVKANGLRLLNCTEDLYGDVAAGRLPDLNPAIYQVQTFYEKMFLEQGYKITYMSFVIDHEGDYVYPEFDAAYWRSVEGPRRSFGHQERKG